ncbi:MAG: hypothetical protein ACPGOV_12185 [Magnetovibrionaceae bacterium]
MSEENVRLSFSFSPLPGAVALTRGNQVLACGLEETVTNRPGDDNLPLGALEASLLRSGLAAEAISSVCCVGDPRLDFERLLARALLCFPHLNAAVMDRAAHQIERGYLTPKTLLRQKLAPKAATFDVQDPIEAWAAAAVGLLDAGEQEEAIIAVLSPLPGQQGLVTLRHRQGHWVDRKMRPGWARTIPALLQAAYRALEIERGDRLKALSALAESCPEEIDIDLAPLLGPPGSGLLARRRQYLALMPAHLAKGLIDLFGLPKTSLGGERARAAKGILSWIDRTMTAEIASLAKQTGCNRIVLAGLAGQLPPLALPDLDIRRDQRPLGLTAVLGGAANGEDVNRPCGPEDDGMEAIKASGLGLDQTFQTPKNAAGQVSRHLGSGGKVALYWGPWALGGTDFGAGVILETGQQDSLLLPDRQASKLQNWLDRPTALGPFSSGHARLADGRVPRVLIPAEAEDPPFALQVLHHLLEGESASPLSAKPLAMPSEPPVCSANAALRALAYSDIDLLLLDDKLISKRIAL